MFFPIASGYFCQKRNNFRFQPFNVCFYFLQWARWFITIKMAVQRYFIADFGFAVIHPSIRNVRQHFAPEVVINVFFQRHIFRVAQIGIRFRGVLRGGIGLANHLSYTG